VISIVIPSYNAEETIGPCLDALAAQRAGTDREIIVVDSSRDRTPEIVSDRHPGVRLVRRDRRTDAGAARTIGTTEAAGDTVAFIDADCIAEPGWLSSIDAARRGGHQAVGGAIICANPLNEPAAWAGYLAEFREFIPERPRGLVDHLPTANIAYHRSLLERFGPFPGEFYPQEDLVFNRRLRDGGQRILFDPAMRVRHRHRPAIGDFLRHQRRIGRATAAVLQRFGGPGAAIARRPFLALLAAPLLPPLKFARTAAVFIRYRRGRALRPVLAWPLLALGLGWWYRGFFEGSNEPHRRGEY